MRTIQPLLVLLVTFPVMAGGRQITLADKGLVKYQAGPPLSLICTFRDLDQARPVISDIQGPTWYRTRILFVFAHEGDTRDIEAYAPKGRLWRSHRALMRAATRAGVHPVWASLPTRP